MTNRWQGSWRIIVSLVVICMFLFPFTVLMSATTKKLSRVLLTVCGVVLFGHFLEMIVLVMPVMHPEGYAVGYVWMDISALVLVLGLTGFGVTRSMEVASLVPEGDPYLGQGNAEFGATDSDSLDQGVASQ